MNGAKDRDGSKDCYGFFHKKYYVTHNGKEFPKNPRNCDTCKLAQWCREAHDRTQLSKTHTCFDNIAYSEDYASDAPELVEPDPRDIPAETPVYTRSDLLEVVAFLLAMDLKTLDILDEKIRDPEISFAKIGAKQKKSRQAIHKAVLQICEKHPELDVLIRNNRKEPKQETFMEAVCRIKRETSKKRSKQRKEISKSSGILTYLMQNLDLSRMSIFKDVRNLRKG
jgi:biotin operon repressor